MLGRGLAAILLAATLAACEDPNGAANKLLVEVSALIEGAQKAAKTDPLGAYKTMEDAQAKLGEIVKRYPSSDVAAKLASGQAIGTISMARVENELAELAAAACPLAPDVRCLAGVLPTIGELIEEPALRVAAFTAVARYAFEVGEVDVARHSQARAHEAMAGIPPKYWYARFASRVPSDASAAREYLVRGYIAQKAFDEALAVAKGIRYVPTRIDAYIAIAEAMIVSGEAARAREEVLGKALEVASGMERPEELVAAYASVAKVISASGDATRTKEVLAEALNVAAGLGDAWKRATAYTALARVLIELGDERGSDVFAEALSAARRTQKNARSHKLCSLGRLAADSGRPETALDIADEMLDLEREDRLAQHTCVILVRAHAGAMDAARALAQRPAVAELLVELEMEVARRDLARGDRKAAEQHVAKVLAQRQPPGGFFSGIWFVLEVLADLGDANGVLRVSKSLTEDHERARVLKLIARAQAVAGDKRAALQSVARLHDLLPARDDPQGDELRWLVVASIAELLPFLR